MREIVEIIARIAEIERRLAGMVRHGTVEQVDPARHRVRLAVAMGVGMAGMRAVAFASVTRTVNAEAPVPESYYGSANGWGRRCPADSSFPARTRPHRRPALQECQGR